MIVSITVQKFYMYIMYAYIVTVREARANAPCLRVLHVCTRCWQEPDLDPARGHLLHGDHAVPRPLVVRGALKPAQHARQVYWGERNRLASTALLPNPAAHALVRR